MQAIIGHYRANYEHRVAGEAAYFGDDRQTIAEAVRRAALSLLANGNIHGHQRRPGKAVMQVCAEALVGHEDAFARSKSFADLHAAVRGALGGTYGAGKLVCYDIAERIGWRLRLEPEAVYLHSGAGDGARVLRPDLKGETVAPGELAPELAQLEPAHVENLLCIYKEALGRLKAKGAV